MDGHISKPIDMEEGLNKTLSCLPEEMKPDQGSAGPLSSGENGIDGNRMQDLADSLGESLGEIIESYIRESPIQIRGMQAALQRLDYEVLGRIAHSLKSSSGIFGARKLVEYCLQIEVSARSGHQVSEESLRVLDREFESIRSELVSYLASNPSAQNQDD